MMNTIKEYSPEQKQYTTINEIHKYYDSTNAVVSMSHSSLCDDN